MTDQHHEQSPEHSIAWSALITHLNSLQPTPRWLIRAAWLEHLAQTDQERLALWAECMELRHTWVEAAEMIQPSLTNDLKPHLDRVVHTYGLSSPPKPPLPRVGLWWRFTDFVRRHFS